MAYIDKDYGDLTIYENYLKCYFRHLACHGVKLLGKNTRGWFKLQYALMNFPNKVNYGQMKKYVQEQCLLHDVSYDLKNEGSDVTARELWAFGYYVINGKNSGKTIHDTSMGCSFCRLHTMTEPNPMYNADTRKNAITTKEFEELKDIYCHKCATCGCESNHLQKGHKDPNKPLSKDNCIPQCPECNETNKNNIIFSDCGAVSALNTTFVFDNSDILIQTECIKNFMKNHPIEFASLLDSNNVENLNESN